MASASKAESKPGSKPGSKPESKLESNPPKKDGGKHSSKKSHSPSPSESSKHHSRRAHEKYIQGERKSLLDVINKALIQTGRATYLHRLIYVGQHSFKDAGEGSEELDSIFQSSVNLVNENYCSEPLTGCFIYYSKYFIHIVEGAEDSIGEHVKSIVEQIKKHEYQFGAVKIILQCHHIRRRYFGAWFSMYGVPHALLERIQGDADDVITEQLENFYKKIVTIASYLESDAEKNTGSYLNQETLALLPETQLLDFLLKIDCLENLNDFLSTFQHFPHLVMYEDECWPAIMDFVPYNLYIEIPEIEKLEVPPYHPIEEIEVEIRMKGYVVTDDEKIQEPIIDSLLEDAVVGDKSDAKGDDQQTGEKTDQQADHQGDQQGDQQADQQTGQPEGGQDEKRGTKVHMAEEPEVPTEKKDDQPSAQQEEHPSE